MLEAVLASVRASVWVVNESKHERVRLVDEALQAHQNAVKRSN